MHPRLENDEGTSLRPLIPLAAATAAVMFVFPLCVRFPLLDPDEGIHAAIAQEMVERGHWLTPSLLGKPFWDKPILYSWVQAASLWVFGPNEAAVRLPGLMFGLLGAITTGLLAWRLFRSGKGDRFNLCEAPGGPFRQIGPVPFSAAVGLIAGILYATTILPTALAQAASHDVALVPWINLTLLFFWEADRAARRRSVAGCLLGAGVMLGLSILTKGLAGPAVVAVAYGGYQLLTWLSRKLRPAGADIPVCQEKFEQTGRQECLPRRTCLRAMFVLLVAVLVAGPWYLAAQSQNADYLSYYFLDRHLLAFVTGTQPHGDQPWWYYLPLLLLGGLPWIGYLPVMARGREAGDGEREGEDCKLKISNLQFAICNLRSSSPVPRPQSPAPLLWCWLIGWLLFLTAARSKLATYLWPAFPPVAILAAVAWVGVIEGTLGQRARRSFARTFVFSSWSGPVVLPAAVLAMQLVFGLRYSWPAWVAVLIAAAVAPLPLLAWRAGRAQASLAAAVLSLAAQFVAVMTVVLPPAAEIYSARELAEHFNRIGQLPPRLWMAEERIGSLVFYLDPGLRAGLRPGQIQQLVAKHPPPLRPGDVVALPDQKRYRTAGWLDLEAYPCETVGRFRLYFISIVPPSPNAAR